MAISLAPECFKVTPGKTPEEPPALPLTRQALKELRAVYRDCTLHLHGLIRRTCIYRLNIHAVFRIPGIKLIHKDGTCSTHVVRPDFLLPYHVHCAADCLGVPEVLTEGGGSPGLWSCP